MVVASSAVVGDSTSSPVEMSFGPSQRQRRWTVFFRPVLTIPQDIALFFVGIAAFVVLVLGWFAALFTGKLPNSFAEFLSGYLRWVARVEVYRFLMTDKYPPFSLQPSAASRSTLRCAPAG